MYLNKRGVLAVPPFHLTELSKALRKVLTVCGQLKFTQYFAQDSLEQSIDRVWAA